MKIALPFAVLALSGCVTHSQSGVVDRRSEAYAEAVSRLGGDAHSEFAKQSASGRLVFYAIGEHPFRQNCSFPGLSQEEVDEYIGRKKIPFEVKFENVAPIIVKPNGPPFDTNAYFQAVDDLLSTYNQLVLGAIKQKETLPNQSPQPTRSSVTPAAEQPARQSAGAADL